MPLELVTLRCRTDNYAYIVKGDRDGEVALIDAPEAAPIIAALEERGWHLGAILLTHHHSDHVDGVEELRARYDCKVVGPLAEADRLPPLDRRVADGDTGGAGDFRSVVMAVPGHTLGHVAYHFPQAGLAFTADSLMALGCGRLFEGTPAMMWDSLSRLNALPADTLICSGHDYCAGNGAFALSVDPDNQALRDRLDAVQRADQPCAPATLALERETNPFLRVAALRVGLGMEDAPDAEVFARLRAMKDSF